ncbi:MAG TPA: CoA-disulfide reductase [Bacillota bacterium]|nr:CoA-disulfide reductase [Bacillota bacterium]
MKLIVIGGVAAGMSCAAKLRRMDSSAEITVYEKGKHLSYGACGLPYYISGVSADRDKLIARTREEYERNGINCFLQHEVLKVIPGDKSVLVKDHLNGNVFIDKYDKLMIAVGAGPVIPPIEGRDLKGVFTLKSLDDGDIIKNAVDENVKDIVVAGGGYIGIEMAEAFRQMGRNVTVIEMADRILTPFDEEIASLAIEELLRNHVILKLGERLERIDGRERVERIVTSKGEYKADLVLMALGIRPATEFLKGSGIHMTKNGAIIVDREMRTNLDDIYAAGDCALVYHLLKEENAYIPLGTVANKCGRIAGENVGGKHRKYIGTVGSAAIKVFDIEMARTGLSEKEAKELSIDYDKVVVDTQDLPPYYPEPSPIRFKLIYEKGTKRILGAQGAGKKGVVLRIDIFAAAITGGATTDELGMTDLCYAPPFAGVWDAVNIVCNAAK